MWWLMHCPEGMLYFPFQIQNCLALNTLRICMHEILIFGDVFNACEKVVFGKFYRRDGFLFRENKLCVPVFFA
jgi:hypothetical protein